MSVELGYLLRRAVRMPPHQSAYRAGRMVVRFVADRRAKRAARKRCSYSPVVDGARLERRLAPLDLPGAEPGRALLEPIVRLNADRRFDLLGSGWVRVEPGMTCDGMEGVRFPPPLSGDAPVYRMVAPANRARAASVYALIDDPGYRPVDWRLDYRSGYVWPADTYFADLEIGGTRGADIKMPWELGRLQHLPRMALYAVLSPDEAATMRREVRNQVLDFIASNPPQFGANWGCPMDVGIRAANLCLAVDLFEQAGHSFDADFHGVLCASLTDHGRHIARSLEWAPEGRSNHYLSDLVGLVFLGAYLPATDETLGWLAYGLVETAAETMNQFHADGGNYEGSVGYHRLSSELVTYAFALALGLSDDTVARLAELPDRTGRFDRVPDVEELGRRAVAIVAEPPRELAARLAEMARFMDATAAPDGRIVQIGDTDSGRLFKLDVAPDPAPDDRGRPVEDALSVASSLAALRALSSDAAAVEPGGCLAAAVVRALCGGRPLAATPVRSSDVTSVDAAAAAGDPRSERVYRIALPDGALRGMTVEAFPDFGLWVWRTPRLHLTFRCAGHDRPDAPYGHTHDDNLGLTLWVDGEWRIEDPGTYVYTSFPELRNAYRMASAHFVPRAKEWEAVAFDPTYLFDCRQRVTARMVKADADGAEAEMAAGRSVIRRRIALTDGLLVTDRAWGCHLDPDIPAAETLRAGRGYGRRADSAQRFPAATGGCL